MSNKQIPIPKTKKIVDLLISGDFTIAYHDNGQYSIYTGRYKEYDDITDAVPFIDSDQHHSEGYIPTEVELLVKALNGKVVTI